MTKFYIDDVGNYLGGFDGAKPPDGAIEIPTPPQHGLDKWINGAWVLYDFSPTLAEKQDAYDIGINDLVYLAFSEAVADAITAGVPINAKTLRDNGRDKLKDL